MIDAQTQPNNVFDKQLTKVTWQLKRPFSISLPAHSLFIRVVSLNWYLINDNDSQQTDSLLSNNINFGASTPQLEDEVLSIMCIW